MSVTVTVIADKDIGSVLGAVTETSADLPLKVEQVVAPSGFPMRDAIAVTLEVPTKELTAAATTSLQAVTEPRSYVVKDGVPEPIGAAMTITAKLAVGQIDITLPSGAPTSGELKVKAFLHHRNTDRVETLAATKYTLSGTGIALSAPSLRPGVYDALVLVEGCRLALLEDQTI